MTHDEDDTSESSDLRENTSVKIKSPAPITIKRVAATCGRKTGTITSPPCQIRGLCTSAVKSPHPDKVETGGEDACFVRKKCLGVFDGVGAWRERGIDSGLYSRRLARLTSEFAALNGPEHIVRALKWAAKRNEEIGSSTACVAALSGTQLHGVSVGDTSLGVIRDGQFIFMTNPLQHSFNFPYQLGTNSDDRVEDGQMFQFQISPEDVVICASDGLWDNVYPDQILSILRVARLKYQDLNLDGCECQHCLVMKEAATQLARTAKNNAEDEEWFSPFALQAREGEAEEFPGGKMDDVTVTVSYAMEETDLRSWRR
ncbi:unnamed protein product [Chondrus crispus]|uniref:Protein phosphatase n=1 Tax=Chondrus crispus TaxID=2769 RepID=R7QTX5_CHOCR|nr:unnamed protein product [Chondrus crispus]CDF41163.1 unnamed protein product [Chondrus crispus]|eukprot:XP_005711457.1 unnamed protein product [Chondrus crispus]